MSNYENKVPHSWFPVTVPPKWNHTPDDDRIFVFGSNLLGIHGAGAAHYAADKLGAEFGIGEGLTGQTYALPTCYRPGEPVTFAEMMVYVENFLTFARSRPDLTFFVSMVGCGIAGFSETEVGPLFKDAPGNCDLPPEWRAFLCERIVSFGPQVSCNRPATHMFRYDYIDEGLGRQFRRHSGGSVFCDEHTDDSMNDFDGLGGLDNEAFPRWVKL